MSPKILLGLAGMVKFLASEMKMTSRKADFLGKIRHSILVNLTLRFLVSFQERLSSRRLDTCV